MYSPKGKIEDINPPPPCMMQTLAPFIQHFFTFHDIYPKVNLPLNLPGLDKDSTQKF